jgi:hypothetical protein
MGRWSFSSKNTVEDCKKIDMAWLKKNGLFRFALNTGTITWTLGERKSSIGIEISIYEDLYARFMYTITDSSSEEKKKYDYKVPLITTPCNYDGKRYWFKCSLIKDGQYCGKRVRTLYKSPNADYFGCRHCYNLTYEARNENRRYKNYPLFFWFKSWKKMEELEEKIKRPYYRSKPTRKQRKLEKVEGRLIPYIDLLKKMGV